MFPSEMALNHLMKSTSHGQTRITGQSTLSRSTMNKTSHCRRISKRSIHSLVLQLILVSGRLFVSGKLEFVLDIGSNVNDTKV